MTMGDSLTDKRHWANREVCWLDLLRDAAEGRSIRSDVTIVNPAIGGTQLRQNLVLIPRWLDRAPEPDLVTIFFGGNDWDAGMRGEEFRASLRRRRRPRPPGDPGQGRRADPHHEPLRGPLGDDRGAGRGVPDGRRGPQRRPGGHRAGLP